MLRVPANLHGDTAMVMSRSRKVVRRLLRGEALDPLFGELVAVRDADGLVFVDGPPREKSAVGFHCWAPVRSLLVDQRRARTADWRGFLELPWGGLALLGQGAQTYLDDLDFCRGVLRWCLLNVDAIEELGPRFSTGSSQGTSLWEQPSTIWQSLAWLGVDAADIAPSTMNLETFRTLVTQVLVDAT